MRRRISVFSGQDLNGFWIQKKVKNVYYQRYGLPVSIGNGYGVCIRRECIDAIGLYDETIQTGQDTEFLFRLAEKYNFETIPEVLVRLHTHSSSRLNDERNNLMRLELRERFLLKHEKLLKEFPDLYYVHYKVVARLCYALKLKQRGRKTMLEIIRNSSFRITNFSDILFFELSGKDTVTLIINSNFVLIEN